MRLMTVLICASLVFSPVYSLEIPSFTPVQQKNIKVYGGGAAGGDVETYADDEYHDSLDREALFVFGGMVTLLGVGCFAAIQGVQESSDLDDSQKDAASIGLGISGLALIGFGIWMMAEGDGTACGKACGEAGCEIGCQVAAELAARGCIDAILNH